MKAVVYLASLVALSCSALIPEVLQQSANPTNGQIHALLVAGSNGWWNYRHQADVAHAFHTLKNHGVPEENIIVMMYDDIAQNRRNPFKGKLFNEPHGEDVYAGLKIDYKESSVTPDNFLNILQGKAHAVVGGNGRVINSTRDDRIFVFFSDHGSVGLIAFPDDMLTVKQLNDALKWMHKNKRYSQLVFYLEACESGSMFSKVLKNNIGVYAVTAANGDESSYATYCENDMGLPCMGDEFSVNWMEDSDKEDLNAETLDKQFTIVKKLTSDSHVMHYGNLSIAQEPVAWFQGQQRSQVKANNRQHRKVSWPSRDVVLLHHVKKFGHESAETIQILKERQDIESVFISLINDLIQDPAERRRVFAERASVEYPDCHDDVVRMFDLICMDVN